MNPWPRRSSMFRSRAAAGSSRSPAGTLLALTLAFVAAGVVPAAGAAGATPSAAISPVERAAVGWALEYLDQGPAALAGELAESSPLRREGGAAAQIELRAGPPEGARWRLATSAEPDAAVFHLELPSGLEEALRLRAVEQDGTLRLFTVEASWELPAAARPAEAPETPAAGGAATPAAGPALPPALAAALGLGGLLAFWLASIRQERRALFLALGGLLLAAGAGLLLAPRLGGGGAPSAAGEGPAGGAASPEAAAAPRGQDRLEWRRALASGRAPLGAMPAGAGAVQLWAAEEAILANRLDDAAKALAAAGSAGESAAAARVAARLARRRGDGTGEMAAYLELVRRWPYDELYLAEAIEATYQLGFERQGKELTAELRRHQPRAPEGLRLLALADAIDGLPTAAGEALAAAIRSAPQRRIELLGNPLEAYLLEAAPEVERLLALGEPGPPLYPCSDPAPAPLEARPGAAAFRVGASLFYEIGAARLEIPGGCGLAPAGATELTGEAWLDRRDAARVAAADALGRSIAATGGQPSPRERQQLGETLAALAAGQDFGAILALTEKLDGQARGTLPDTARRAWAAALQHLGRRREAFDLMVQWLGADLEGRRSDPGMLFDFAELMALERQYELAGRLLAAADRRLPEPVSQERRIQLDIERKLLEKSLHLDRPPFRIYFSAEKSPAYVEQVAAYLGRERQRLAAFVPPPQEPRQIEVLLLEPRDFRQSYGGGGVEILGLYDGRIRVPLGRLRSLNPFAESLLTHELVHALIADASADRAPHWLQEGLAQLAEPGRRDANPIAAMKDRGAWLAFPLIEGALSGMATDKLAQQGYDEALWAAVYLQSTRGRQIFGRLLAAYRREASEEEIFRRELGLTPAQLDAALVAWGRSGKLPIYESP